ncbi:hypothetical protein FB107DRAFT_203443 [Schizophyllum commune]
MPAKTMVERRSGATKRSSRMGRTTKSRKGCSCFDPPAPETITNCPFRCRSENLVYKKYSMTFQDVYKSLFDTPRDDAHLCFYGKTPAESRCILWATCTHPLNDAKRISPQILGSLAELFYHYEIIPLQHWAVDALQEMTSFPSTLLHTCSTAVMAYISRVALLYRLKPWYDHILKHWNKRLLFPSKHPLPPEEAIIFGAQTSNITLQANASYAYLIHHLPRIAADARVRTLRTPYPLKPVMYRHIVAGYLSLNTLAAKLRSQPPDFARAPECAECDHWKCQLAWANRWQTVFTEPMSRPVVADPMSRPVFSETTPRTVAGDSISRAYDSTSRPCDTYSVDIIDRLTTAHSTIRRDTRLARQMNDACREAAIAALKKAKTDVMEHLEHHFDL